MKTQFLKKTLSLVSSLILVLFISISPLNVNSQEASALIVVTQHYDTLQSVGSESNSNLILMPNSPQSGSDMLNNMVASFTASNQIGEQMKKAAKEKEHEETK